MQSEENEKPDILPAPQNKHEAPAIHRRPETVAETPSEDEAAAIPEGQWTFRPEDGKNETDNSTPAHRPSANPVSWTASEYVAHQKSALWFIGLGLVISGTALIIYILTQEVISTVVFVVIGIAFGVFAARPPQVLNYSLDDKGLNAGTKFYPYEQFKSFSLIDEDAIRSISLMPMQRFMPPLSIYYDPADEDKIIQIIGSYLPLEDRSHDIIDRFMRKIRF